MTDASQNHKSWTDFAKSVLIRVLGTIIGFSIANPALSKPFVEPLNNASWIVLVVGAILPGLAVLFTKCNWLRSKREGPALWSRLLKLLFPDSFPFSGYLQMIVLGCLMVQVVSLTEPYMVGMPDLTITDVRWMQNEEKRLVVVDGSRLCFDPPEVVVIVHNDGPQVPEATVLLLVDENIHAEIEQLAAEGLTEVRFELPQVESESQIELRAVVNPTPSAIPERDYGNNEYPPNGKVDTVNIYPLCKPRISRFEVTTVDERNWSCAPGTEITLAAGCKVWIEAKLEPIEMEQHTLEFKWRKMWGVLDQEKGPEVGYWEPRREVSHFTSSVGVTLYFEEQEVDSADLRVNVIPHWEQSLSP